MCVCVCVCVVVVLPFGNVHAVLTVDGETIIGAIENGLRAIGNTEINGRMSQIGGSLSVLASFGAPPGKRVRQVLINGQPIVRRMRYRVVTNEFLANGGDGYVWNDASDVNLSGRALDTLLAQYLTRNNPYTVPTTNSTSRITNVDDVTNSIL